MSIGDDDAKGGKGDDDVSQPTRARARKPRGGKPKRREQREAIKSSGKLELTPEIARRVCEALSLGLRPIDAAALVGVHRDVLARWLAEGRKREPGDVRRDFYDQVGVAISQAKLRMVAKLHKATDWKASAWILERRWPDEWGPRQTVDIGQARPIESDEEAEQRRAALRAALEDGEGE